MLARMANSHYIVVTLHCPGGFHSRLFRDEADQLPVANMSSGFSQMVLVFTPSGSSAARDFAISADSLRNTDPRFQELQVGVAAGSLREPLRQPMPDDEAVVIESFKTGLSRSKFLQELEKVTHTSS